MANFIDMIESMFKVRCFNDEGCFFLLTFVDESLNWKGFSLRKVSEHENIDDTI